MASAERVGVNVVGYVDSESGTGEIARGLLASLRAAGIPHTVIANRMSSSRKGAIYVAPPTKQLFDVNIVCCNADELPRVARRLDGLLNGRYTIGIWAWEVDALPSHLAASSEYVQEIWGISEFTAGAIRDAVEVPVHVFALPAIWSPPSMASRENLGLPPGFVFLFCFDYLSVFERKNPLAVVHAFRKAFPRDSADVSLVIKSINSEVDPRRREQLLHASVDRQDIVVLDGYFKSADQAAIIARCDAYVSLHRSEGYGLTLAEAMLHAKPVIATAYSGNLEFMNDSNSWLVPYELVAIPPGCDPYPSGGHWADPSVDAAAAAMQEIVGNPQERGRRAQRGQDSVQRLHSPMARASFLEQRLRAAEQAVTRSRGRREANLDRLRPTSTRAWVAKARVRLLEKRLRPAYSVAQMLRNPYRTARGVIARLARRYTRVDKLASDMARIDFELSAPPYKSDPEALLVTGRYGTTTLGYDDTSNPNDGPAAYVEFEDVFRGSEATIREGFRRYSSLLAGQSRVVDIGCGRGEFLDVAAENGIRAIGVDLDPGMLERAGSKGHSVELKDAVQYLESAAEGELDLIFSAQLIEHVAPDSLSRLLNACHRALRPGGMLIAETVNPHSPMAAKTFWLDFTHQRPIFPEALLFLCRSAGFAKGEIFFPRGVGDLEIDRRIQGEYAVLATKGFSAINR
jgi:glycosyltransferase involved in cell wall biosynthesis/SAM-dependent methyltransferase